MPARSRAAQPRLPVRPAIAGFTLIELVTVVVILGVLSAYLAPRMFDASAFSARGYADELATSIQYAQSVASSSACPARISIDAAGYSAAQPSAPCLTSGAYSLGIWRNDGSALAGTTPTGVSVAPSVQVNFDQNGRISGAPPAMLRVGRFRLAIDPVSGYVTVQ